MTMPLPIATESSVGCFSWDEGNLAQDLNGLVQVAVLKLDLLKASAGIDSGTSKIINDLEKVLRDMSQVTHSALTTVHPNSVATVEPGEVIDYTVALVRALGRESIKIEVLDPPRNIRVPIPQSHLQQVVFNLTRSAVESLPDAGGCVVVSASIKEPGYISPGAIWVSRQSLCLTVESHRAAAGRGLRSCFFRNPFATQHKGPSQSIIHCQKLLEIYGGTLTYERLDGSGNRARIVWPF